VFERLHDLEEELDKLEAELPSIYASGDRHASRDAGRRYQELKPVVDTYREYQRVSADRDAAEEVLQAEADPELRAFYQAELNKAQTQLAELEIQINELLIPADPNMGKNTLIEIRGAEGGEEGNIWAGDLFRMYERYAELHGSKIEVLSSQLSDMGGFKEISFTVKGEQAWARFKYEGGPHRVQRIPQTESQGRVHTSAATVAVLPEAEEVDIEIDPNDLQIDVYRSSGPGGQSINTTDSAVRLTHLPTGLVVTCQDEKSQLQNKDKAMRILRSRLLQIEQEKRDQELADTRKSQVGGGGRSEKIRTYNYKDNRVTDHRIGLTVHSLDQVLAGHLDEIVDALTAAERAEQLAGEAD